MRESETLTEAAAPVSDRIRCRPALRKSTLRTGRQTYPAYLFLDIWAIPTSPPTAAGCRSASCCIAPSASSGQAWGETRFSSGTTPTTWRFTGRREDATIGLYFYNARYLDPALGRFAQADTIVPEPGDPQSLNRYSYANNNSLKYTDPSGHRACAECVGGGGGGAILAAGAAGGASLFSQTVQALNVAMADAQVFLQSLAQSFGNQLPALVDQVSQAGQAAQSADQAGNTAGPGGLDPKKVDLSKTQTAVSGGEVLRRWGPQSGPGPLPEKIAATFRSASYSEVKLTEDVTLYRSYGGKAGQLGSFWTRTQPSGPLQAQLDAAILPEWGNSVTQVAIIRVPAGTIIYEGYAAEQVSALFKLLGGGNQVYIPLVDPSWLVW